MKNIFAIGFLPLRGVASSLLAAIVAWSVLPVYACDEPASAAKQAILNQSVQIDSKFTATANVKPNLSASFAPKLAANVALPQKPCEANVDVQELKDRVKELEAKERQNYAIELEGQRKKVDWWLSFLGIMLAGLAIFTTVAGIAIPYVIARKNKEIFDLDKKAIEQDKKAIEQDRTQVRIWLDEIENLKHKANADTKTIGQSLDIVNSSLSATSEDAQKTARRTASDETADPLLLLHAKAVEASRPESAQAAYTLWATLTELDAQDANAMFNAGYWAYILSEQTQGDEKLRWLKRAQSHYALALTLKPDMHEVANNWGVTLNNEAKLLAATNLAAARALWLQAGEKYQWALSIKSDKHEAAINWGGALITEASTNKDVTRSQQLLSQAEQLLLAHADAAPGLVAYNLACLYGLRADIQQCLHWLNICQSHKELPDCSHLRADKDLDAVRNSPEFIAWLATVCNDEQA